MKPVKGMSSKTTDTTIAITGGTLMELRFKEPADVAVLRATLDQAGITGAEIQQFGSTTEYTVRAQDRKQRVHAAAQPGCLDFFRVLAGVPCEDEFPAYHGAFFEHLTRGVFMFLTRESRIPGTDRR